MKRARRSDAMATLLTPSHRRRRWRPALFAAVLVLASPPAPAGAARTITMSGEPLTQRLVSDLVFYYRRETPKAPRFSIVGGGTAGGIADAARGIVDAGLVSRAPTPDEPALVLTPVALSAICFVTNPANAVPHLTRAQIQDIVAARTTTWAQIPGAGRTDAIVSVQFDQASGARRVFDSVFVDLGTTQTYNPRTFTASSQVRDFVAGTPGALAYLDVAYTATLHVVPYQGVTCSRATIGAGTYPGRRTLGVVTRGRPKGELERFLRWIRTDSTAKRVIATRYVVPS
jgi:ABC-type phosphate transport system substrate-binding protein